MRGRNSRVKRRRPKTYVRLTPQQKEYAVRQLATFRSQATVKKGLREEFGIIITRQGVGRYDPTTLGGRSLSSQWVQLFHTTREKFLKDSASIGASHMVVRIRRREEMADAAKEKGEYKVANDILDSIAKEMGDAFSNRRKHEHSGADGRPIEIEDVARERIFRRLEDLRQLLTSGSAGVIAAGGAEEDPQ